MLAPFQQQERYKDKGAAHLQPGTVVVIHGLKSEAALWMNGQQGRVISYDADVQRHEVRLDMDGNIKKVKEDNLKVRTRWT